MIAELEEATFGYFDRTADRENGLVRDSTKQDAPATIAGSGLALTCYAVAAERGYRPRAELARRARTTLEFFWNAEQSDAPTATGYKGFFYHFLDTRTGERVHACELSTIDSAIVFAGALTAAAYFDGDSEDEHAVRRLAFDIYARADWRWASPHGPAISHGWKPRNGFLRYDWRGYNEALLLYILALGAPVHPVAHGAYEGWTSTYRWRRIYDIEYLYGGPLFMHQLSHLWLDFRGIQDEFMRAHSSDYFENSRRATYVQREYAKRNPRGFIGYDEDSWGITASDGPGPATKMVRGRRRRFFDFVGRGIPFGPDDGTLAPWAVAASLPFAPEIVLPALATIDRKYPAITSEYGYKCSYNPTFGGAERAGSWISKGHYALDQGPVVVMLENFRSGLVWRLLRRSEFIRTGLLRAGFRGGWLSGADTDG
ncbi:glucoamylase family protein [soil metagenome]